MINMLLYDRNVPQILSAIATYAALICINPVIFENCETEKNW